MTDHDLLFKQLLSEFFWEFLELFLPAVSDYLDKSSLVAMPPEVITDITGGDRRTIDLLYKGRFKQEETFFLVHVENQSSPEPEFAKRMFRYFARLSEKYDLPVYPVALFSYDAPTRPELTEYRIEFPDTIALEFRYRAIQLNRLHWRDFLTRPNPVANALMAKMQIAPEERPKVKAECARMLATLQLNPAHSALILTFLDTYLALNSVEERTYQAEIEKFAPEVKETAMRLMSDAERKGLQQGMEFVLLRLLRKRFSALPKTIEQRIESLSVEQMDALTDAVLELQSAEQVEEWLAKHAASN